MWLSSQRRTGEESRTADMGRVTLGGDPAGVYLDGERRDLPVFGPGGYCWRPAPGQQVLVLKGGPAGKLCCVAGAEQEETDLAPGEVAVTAPGGAAVRLGADGSVDLIGTVKINGVPLETLLQPPVVEGGGG